MQPSEAQETSARVRRISLVDCDSFYASCEKVFDPSLESRVILVMSNNDGCVVARSAEAKKIGIPMGEPWFRLAAQAKTNGWIARSSNYELYGSLSSRVLGLLGEHYPLVSPYSIDEAFTLSTGTVDEHLDRARVAKRDIRQRVGIPVSIGIASTKTLAKLMSRRAKDDPKRAGVCSIDEFSPAELDELLAVTPVDALWGVAGRLAKRLAAMNIHTARDLRDAEPRLIRRRFSIVLERTVHELNGVPCIPVEEEPAPKKQIIFSRSFAEPVKTIDAMRQVLSIYAQRAATRLRGQDSVAQSMNVFASTSPYAPAGNSHTASVSVSLPVPTNDPLRLSRAAVAAMESRFQPGAWYVRAGVMLQEISPVASHAVLEPFAPELDDRNVGATLDSIAKRFGHSAIGVGLGGLRDAPAWSMRREMLSPRATTNWDELAVAYAR